MLRARQMHLLALVLAAACARPQGTPASDAAPRDEKAASPAKWLESVDTYPDARPLCDEHVMAAPNAPPLGDAEPIREIHWASFATAASAEEVASFYAARGMHLDGEHKHRSGSVVLSVHLAADPQHPTCAEAAKPGERSVIVVSRALP